MTLIDLIVKILAAGLTLYFIISEAHYIISISDASLYEMFLYDSTLFIITILKSILIFIALPFLYLFKLLDYLGIPILREGRWMSSEYDFFQTKLFYQTIYIIIFILIIIRLIGQTFSL